MWVRVPCPPHYSKKPSTKVLGFLLSKQVDVLQNTMMFTVLLALWALPWKGWALWLALLVLNTLAILDIIYIFVVAKRSSTKVSVSEEEA